MNSKDLSLQLNIIFFFPYILYVNMGEGYFESWEQNILILIPLRHLLESEVGSKTY